MKNFNTLRLNRKSIQILKKINFSLLSVLIVVFLFWLFLLASTKYRGDVLFSNLFYYGFANKTNFINIMKFFAPFLVGAIAVLISFRVGFINIGVAGQMSAAGLVVFFVANHLKQHQLVGPQLAWLPLLFVLGIGVAVLISMFCAGLKLYLGVNEILTTITLNYFFFHIFRFFVSHPDVTVTDLGRLQTKSEINHLMGFNSIVWLIPVSVFLAFGIFLLCAFVFNRTVYGFKLKIVGANPRAAAYAGINYRRQILIISAISGVLAGLAGIFYYYRSYDHTFLFKREALPFNGFDTISIVWLAQNSFFALPFVTFFVALMRNQQLTVATSDLPSGTVEIILGVILFVVAFGNRFLNMSKSERFDLKLKLRATFAGLTGWWTQPKSTSLLKNKMKPKD